MDANRNARAASEMVVMLEKHNNCLRRENAALCREIMRLRAKLMADTAEYEVHGRCLSRIEPPLLEAEWAAR